MRKFLLHLVLIVITGSVSIAYAIPDRCGLSSTDVLFFIKHDGGKATLGRLFESPDWNCFIEKVSTADQQWLGVAGALRPFSDAGASEDIDNALGDAMAISPKAVFEAVPSLNDKRSLDWVCGALPVDEESGSDARALAILEKRKEALRALRDEKWEERKGICLKHIDSIIVSLKGLSGEKRITNDGSGQKTAK